MKRTHTHRNAQALSWMLLGAVGLAAWLPLWAQDNITIYRCTDEYGEVSLQEAPCDGSAQQASKLEYEKPKPRAPKPLPKVTATQAPALPANPPATASTGAPAPQPTDSTSLDVQAAQAQPPVAQAPATPNSITLFRCRGLDKKSYFSEEGNPPPKCVPLSMLDGLLTPTVTAAGEGCQWIQDECTELRGRDRCKGWRSWRDDAKLAMSQAFSDSKAEKQKTYDEIAAKTRQACR